MSGTIVIGAGLIGATTAYALTRRGEAVSIIDRQDGPGQGASYANGGMLTPSMADPWNAPGVWRDLLRYYGRPDAPMLLRAKALPSMASWGLKFLRAANSRQYEHATRLNVRLGLFSLDMMAEWRRHTPLSYDSAEGGTAKIYRDACALQLGREKAQKMQVHGVAFETLSTEALIERQPALEPISAFLAGGIYFPGDEAGDAFKFTNEILRAAQDAGATALWNNGVERLIVNNGVVSGVVLENGETINAERVVIATGARAPCLAAQAKVSLAVMPVKGYSITFSSEHLPPDERLQFPIVDDGLHAAATPLGDKIRIAGTAEFTGHDLSLDHRRVENLREILRAILPEQAASLETHEVQRWTGFRPMHAYGAPWIGATPVKGVYLNTGHGHLGWTLAAGSAEALSQAMLGEKIGFDLAGYRV